jgi:hypothetical protein
MERGAALRELEGGGRAATTGGIPSDAVPLVPSLLSRLLYHWIRFAIPAAILAVGAWWLLTEVLGLARGV